MTATCSNCPYGTKSEHEGEIDCYNEDVPDANFNPPDWWCSAHPFHPSRVHELAAMAMQGMIANHGVETASPYATLQALASVSYRVARAMLDEAEKESGE